MADGEIKVTYTSIDQALGDIQAMQSVARGYVDIDLGMGQSRGAGTAALQSTADCLSAVATSLSELLGRSYATLNQSRNDFQFADEGSASDIEGIG